MSHAVKFTIHVSDVHNVYVLVLLMYLKWYLGMDVKLGKLHQHHVQKTVLDVSVAKQRVQQTF
jgi:hypothetical protein